MTRTAKEVREELSFRGLTVSGWARTMGFSPGLVYQVLSGRLKCQRGDAHRIAVLLGLKNGAVGGFDDLPFGGDANSDK